VTDDVSDNESETPQAEEIRPEPEAPESPPNPAGNDDGEAPASEPPEAPRVGWPRRLRLAGLVFAVGFVLWLLFTWLTWPDVAALADRDPTTTAFIERYREVRRDAGEPDAVAWQPVPWDRISPNLKRAVIASEDTEFFFHDGFSRHEMKEALKKAIREGEAPRGASTITQQVAKNLWLTPRRSLTRKLREAILTRQLEKHLSKRRILELYLNIVEFGPGIYGAEAAARHYFGIPAAGLSPRQGAMLAAGLPRPKSWNPSSESEYYRARVERILEIESRLDYLDRYVGARAPGMVEIRPPEVPSPVP
jgi:monofunctional biosynthetic peptidoglycan transglycosylase